MREILFRGKRKDTGEWVEGFPYITQKGEYEISWYSKKYNIERMTTVVIPESFGEFTGLFDKNGKKIFEGDIVHCVSKFDSADMVVVFECGQFRRILAEKYHEHQTNVGYYDINCFAKEVIGNIYDNKEILDVK